jgi:hypothetical protein
MLHHGESNSWQQLLASAFPDSWGDGACHQRMRCSLTGYDVRIRVLLQHAVGIMTSGG